MRTSQHKLSRPIRIDASCVPAASPARPLRLEHEAPERDDVSQYDELIALLHECSCDSKGWQPFERALASHLGACDAAFVVAASRDAIKVAETAHDASPSDLQFDSPRKRAAVSWRSETGHQIAQWIDTAQPAFVLDLDLSGPPGVHARLRLRRSIEMGEFVGRDRTYVSLLLPHLRTAAANHLRYGRALAEHCFALQLLPPVVFLDTHGAVQEVSESAAPLLRKERVIALHGQQLKLLRPEDAAGFQRMLARVLAFAERDPAEWRPEAMNVRRAPGQAPLWLIARPMRSMLGGADRFHVAVLIYDDQDRDADVPVAALQHLLGLTPCEAIVALQLARGKTVKEVTQELGVSLSTTRTHLRSIFSKTSIDKQTKLVRAVLQGMAMLSCR